MSSRIVAADDEFSHAALSDRCMTEGQKKTERPTEDALYRLFI